MESKFDHLSTPTQRITFQELTVNEAYEISKFVVTNHAKHGISLLVEILFNGQSRSLFLPKRFATLEADVPALNSEINEGVCWLLQWQGPAGHNSHAVKIFPKTRDEVD